MKQDPKAYPRTPQDADKAELATAIIRYVMDSEDWNSKDPEAALDCAIEGFAGISIRLEEKANQGCARRIRRSEAGTAMTMAIAHWGRRPTRTIPRKAVLAVAGRPRQACRPSPLAWA